MKDTYIFPALLYYQPEGVSVEFPDLPGCLSCADSTEEAAKNAREAMGLHLWGMEQDGEEIPAPTEIPALRLEDSTAPLLVEVFMPPVRDRLNSKYVKKTLTLPQWLNAEAEHAGVNFSQLLQSSLKDYLHIKD